MGDCMYIIFKGECGVYDYLKKDVGGGKSEVTSKTVAVMGANSQVG